MLRPITNWVQDIKSLRCNNVALSSISRKLALSSVLGFGLTMTTAVASIAAETVYAKYSVLEFEMAIAELQAYAEKGEEPELIKNYGALLTSEQLEQLRQALGRELEIPPAVLARFLSTPSGYRLLESLTDVVHARSPEIDSVLALRTGIILAASSDHKLTLVNLLKSFPSQGVELNFDAGMQIFQALEVAVNEHKNKIAGIKQSSSLDANVSTVSPTQYQRQGQYSWQKLSFQLTDQRPVRLQSSGQPRSFPLDVYVPKGRPNEPKPLIILSHGLGSGLSAFQYLAEHFASHGYVVAVPEHPGSSVSHWRALLKSETNLISTPQEFIDRPLDIQYLLDDLTAKNLSHPVLKGQIDLDQIGLFGHSYGGYTALAIAGADIDFSRLQAICSQDIVKTFNPSLLLQCQASTLSSSLPSLQDDRVKALFVTHPIVSAVLGDQGLAPIEVPVALLSGGADVIAPLVPEQLMPFKKLNQTEKYFVLLEQADHFATIGEIAPQEELFVQSEGASDIVNIQSRQMMKALGLGFFNQKLSGETSEDVSFLSFVRSLNRPNFPVYGLGHLPESFAVHPVQ